MKNLFINFALAGLFIVALVSFVAQVETNNGVTDGIMNDEILNKTIVDLDTSLGGFQTLTDNQSINQDTEDPQTEGGNLLFLSITQTGKTLKSMIMGVYNVIVVLPSKLLKIPQLAMIVISSIVSIVLVLGAWRLYKAGE